MKVIDRILSADKTLFSFEIVPPPRGRSAQDIFDVVEELAPLAPAWIDVTSHSSTTVYQEKQDGSYQKRTLKKRPGTLGICGIIQNRFGISTVAHILCQGFSKEETEDALIELNFLGIENVLALRGDAPPLSKPMKIGDPANRFASDLVVQLKELKEGKYTDELESTCGLDFCVGVAGYPEKHFESPSLKLDIQRLKAKVDAGADYIVTQMFFDNQKYYDFVKMCREAGITVPIVPGLKVIKSVAQLTSLPKSFHIDLPDILVDQMTANPQNAEKIGKEWALKQARELIQFGVPSVHFYVLNDVRTVASIVRELQQG